MLQRQRSVLPSLCASHLHGAWAGPLWVCLLDELPGLM